MASTEVLLDDGVVAQGVVILANNGANAFPNVSGGGDSTSLPVLMHLQTAATGANFAAFDSQDCSSLEMLITSVESAAIGVAVEYKINATGVAVTLLYGDSDTISGITNANQISIRRVDQSNTRIYVYAKAYP